MVSSSNAPSIRESALNRLERFGHSVAFFLELCIKSVTPPFYFGTWGQCTAILVQRCLPPMAVVLLTMSAVMCVQMLNLGEMVRADFLVGGMMGAFTFREIGPVLAAVLIGAQGGSFVTTELGAMRVKEEFDALELLAVDPVRYAVVPRFMAFLIATPILGMSANLGGLFGAHLSIMMLSDMSTSTFWTSVYEYLQPLDIVNGVIKTTIFSVIIAHLACYNGYFVHGGAVQVGQAANRAVVSALISVMAANYVITTVMYGGGTVSLQRF